jgi:hypothetical protein
MKDGIGLIVQGQHFTVILKVAGDFRATIKEVGIKILNLRYRDDGQQSPHKLVRVKIIILTGSTPG